MKTKRISTLFTWIIIINLFSSARLALGQETLSITNRNPVKNGEVETIKGILQVEVLSNNKPIPSAWVHFYIDEEHIGAELTGSDGVASRAFDLLDVFGIHTWKVRVSKQGYDTIWSSKWKFDYQPRPILTLISDFGEVYGEGSYTYGETAFFGVEPEIINLEEGKRLVFVEWISYHENGYTGIENPSNTSMLNNILEIAVWKTQYYLDISCELPKIVSPKSGWYDENTILGIRVDPLPGTEFQYWNGSGKASYSGTDMIQSINIDGPIREEAIFDRENYTLTVENEYSTHWGSGVYPAWENVSFGIEDAYVSLNKAERIKFTGWNSDSKYGYNGNKTEYMIEIGEDILQEANWKKQYYVELRSRIGGNVTSSSGWVDENTRIILEANGEKGYQFMGWSGTGDASYTGLQNNYSVLITSPINETAQWRRIYSVSIESQLPVEGSGDYLEGELVTLEALKSEGLLVRKMFQKWSGDIDSTSNPFTFTLSRDMEITAIYNMNYTFLLVTAFVLVLVGGIAIYVLLVKGR